MLKRTHISRYFHLIALLLAVGLLLLHCYIVILLHCYLKLNLASIVFSLQLSLLNNWQKNVSWIWNPKRVTFTKRSQRRIDSPNSPTFSKRYLRSSKNSCDLAGRLGRTTTWHTVRSLLGLQCLRLLFHSLTANHECFFLTFLCYLLAPQVV